MHVNDLMSLGRMLRDTRVAKAPPVQSNEGQTKTPKSFTVGDLLAVWDNIPERDRVWEVFCNCPECAAGKTVLSALKAYDAARFTETAENGKDADGEAEPVNPVTTINIYVSGDYRPELLADALEKSAERSLLNTPVTGDFDPVALADVTALKHGLKHAENRFADASRDLAAAHQENAVLRKRINRLEGIIFDIAGHAAEKYKSAGIIPL